MQGAGEKRANGESDNKRKKRSHVALLVLFFLSVCVLIRASPFPSGQGRARQSWLAGSGTAGEARAVR